MRPATAGDPQKFYFLVFFGGGCQACLFVYLAEFGVFLNLFLFSNSK